MTYLVKLIDGTVFLGKRPWFYFLIDPIGFWKFRDVNWKHKPDVHKGDKLLVRKTAIICMVKQGG